MTFIPKPGPELSPEVLALRSSLPRKPDAIELRGHRVALRPYDTEDVAELFALSDGRPVSRLGRTVEAYDCDERIWRFLPEGPFPDASALRSFHDRVAAFDDSRSFVVVDHATGELLGSVSYLACDPANLKIELGNIWYTPPAQGAGVNAEAARLLIEHAFALGFQRIEWKCHSENHRSRAAALRLGFVFEGIQDAHRIQKGRRRDTAWYRLLRHEHRSVEARALEPEGICETESAEFPSQTAETAMVTVFRSRLGDRAGDDQVCELVSERVFTRDRIPDF